MPEDIEKEFQDFLENSGNVVPEKLRTATLKQTLRDLTFRPAKFFVKLVSVQLVAGTLTLLVCPQFGLGPLGGGQGLMTWVMEYGPIACALFCGSVFLGSSALFSLFVFRWAERRFLYKQRLWIFPVVGLASVVALMLASAIHFQSLHVLQHLEFAFSWLLGGVVFSQFLYQLGQKLREQWDLHLAA
ncbi:MAG: hypothetical protein KDD39_15660 [Bdellovibrionales bacterium]|nr:hypothetical protein [Bdellovibrionales bacterium]